MSGLHVMAIEVANVQVVGVQVAATMAPACQATATQVVEIQVVVDQPPPLTLKVPSPQPVRTVTRTPANLQQVLQGDSADAIAENIADVDAVTGDTMG